MDSRTPLDRDAPGPVRAVATPAVRGPSASPGAGAVGGIRLPGGLDSGSPRSDSVRIKLVPAPPRRARRESITAARPAGPRDCCTAALRAGARPAPAARDPRRRSLSLRSDTSRPTRHRLQSSIKLSPARPYRSPLDRPSRLDSRLSLAGRAAAASMCLFVSLSSLRLRLLTATSEIVGTSPRPKSASDARQDHLGHPGAHRPAEAFHDELANLVGISSPDPHRLGGRPR